MKAINKVFLGQENKGRGRYFKSRFIEAGLVQYDFGLCLLPKENLDKFVQGFVGCPVIIDHNEVYDDNAEDLRVGTVSRVWFDETDGYYWCEGIIWDERALDLILNKGWSVSCQYDITEIDEQGGVHNGIEFDKTILNGSFEHLALVDAPRYEAALIAVNSAGKKKFLYNKAINSDFKEEEHPRGDDGKFTDGNNGINPNYKEDLKQFIEKAKSNPNERQKLQIGIVSDKLKDVAKDNGYDLSGYNHELDVSGTRHTIKQHGNTKKEESRGQIPITDADFEQIPDIIYNYDNVEFGEEDSKGTPLIKYHKKFTDGTSIYVEEIRTKHKNLTIKTMYKTKKASNSGIFVENPQRSEYTSTIIITDFTQDFNPDITKHKAQNHKETEEMGIIEDLEKLILKAKNKGENMKSKNEDTDKRKLIDEVAGIMKSAGADDELIRTAIGKMKKLAYDKSEAGTADNKAKNEDEDDKDKEEAKNKCRNEEDEEEKPKNKRGKNEDDEDEDEDKEDEYDKLKREVDDEAKNKAKNKARNSISDFKKSFYDYSTSDYGTGYISQKKAIELGKQIF